MLTLLAPPFAAAAVYQPLTLSDAEVERLGIGVVSPVAVDVLPSPRLTARVVVPPAAQHVVAAATAGLLTRLLVAAGDEVAAGAMLAVVESQELIDLQAEYQDAVARLRFAERQLERDGALAGDGIVPARRLEESERDRAQANTDVNRLRRRLALAGLGEAELEALAGGGELSPRMRLRAPAAGTVVEQYAAPGERLHGADPVLRIADLRQLWLELQAPPDVLRELATGQAVVLADAPARPVARISNLGGVLDPATQTVTVRATLLDDAPRFGAGELLTVQALHEGTADTALWQVPSTALVRAAEGSLLLYVRTPRGFDVREVTLVRENGPVSIVSGELRADARLAASGTAALKAMMQD